MIDAATRRRFDGVRKLMSSPNAGEAAAAKARWDAMVARHGDPDERPKVARPAGRFYGTDFDWVVLDEFADASFAASVFGMTENLAKIRREMRDREQYRGKGFAASTWLSSMGWIVTKHEELGTWTLFNHSNFLPDLSEVQLVKVAKQNGWNGK